MKILVLQHERVEHPGQFRQFLTEDGHTWHPIHLDEGEALPADSSGYDALWVMGGPQDVWQEKDHPWLVAEKAFIKAAVVDQGMPFLGLCLGHQLLAEVLGGTVGPSETPEIGVCGVQLTEDGASSVLLDGLAEHFSTLQWHSAEVKTLPAGCTVLATSPACSVQAFGWAGRAYALQFHVEVEGDTVENWAKIDAYATALDKALGEDGAAKLKAGCAAKMADFEAMAERIYINWMQAVAQA